MLKKILVESFLMVSRCIYNKVQIPHEALCDLASPAPSSPCAGSALTTLASFLSHEHVKFFPTSFALVISSAGTSLPLALCRTSCLTFKFFQMSSL